MSQYNLGHVVGATGATGKGISSIVKTGTSGKVDTYTITYTNSTTSTFTVTNGSDASVTIVDALNSDSSTSVLSAKQGKVLNTNKIETSAIATTWGNTLSDSKVPSEKLVKNSIPTSTTDLVNNSNFNYIDADVGDSQNTVNLSVDVLLGGKINTSAIANNLTTSTSGKVLDARQGKALADMIGSAITYINQ